MSAKLKPYPFQRRAIKKMVRFLTKRKTHACYNACDQGLGKCLMTIKTIDHLVDDDLKRVLVICPAVARFVWPDEFEKWSKDAPPIFVYTGSKQTKDLEQFIDYSDRHIIVASYNALLNKDFRRIVNEAEWEFVIADESHNLKNRKAKKTIYFFAKIWPKCKYRIFLSGTPFRTSIVDGHTIFAAILPHKFFDFWKFAHRYCYVKKTHFGHKFIGARNTHELASIISKKFFLRYKKEKVLKDLPAKTFQQITLPWQEYAVVPRGKTEKEQLKMEAEIIKRALDKGQEVVAPSCLAEHLHLQGMKKVKPAIDFAKEFLKEGKPVIIFAKHKAVIAGIAKGLKKYNPVIITGATSNKDRREAVRAFQAGETLVFIGNLRAAGEAITLTASSTVILVEYDWSPAVIAQAVDRAHRIGQKDHVMVYYILVKNSIEEVLTETIITRAKDFGKVLGD